jgi:hypothetical protein
LNELKDAAEHESDELLVELVRIQRFTQEIFEFNHRNEVAYSSPGLIPHQTPSPSHISEAQAELERLRISLPQSLKSNCRYLLLKTLKTLLTKYEDLLSSHYSNAQVRLLEPQLSQADPWNDAISVALRTWFNTWLAMPACYYFYMPMPGFGQLIYTVTFLARRARIILLARDRARDGSAGTKPLQPTPQAVVPNNFSEATEELMLGVLESLAVRFASAKDEMVTIHGGDWNNDFLDVAARTLRVIKPRIERWCEIVTAGIQNPFPKDQMSTGVDKGEEQTLNAGRWWLEQLDGPWLDENGQGSWLWAIDEMDVIYSNELGI